MKPPSFAAAAAAALLAPLLLIVGRAVLHPHPQLWSLAPVNWLYMAAPQLIMVAVGALHAPARRWAWLPLLLLTLLLFGVQAWVLWWVPARESALAWILYLPLALAVIVLSTLGLIAVSRGRPGVQISDDA
jgi:hypothetical protein